MQLLLLVASGVAILTPGPQNGPAPSPPPPPGTHDPDEDNFLDQAIAGMSPSNARIISGMQASSKLPEGVYPAPKPALWERVKAYMDGTSNESVPVNPTKVSEIVDPISRTEAKFINHETKELRTWEEKTAPKFLAPFDMMKAVVEALAALADQTNHKMNELTGTTALDTKRMVVALSQAVESYDYVLNSAKKRHGDAWLEILTEAKGAEVRTAKDARKEWTLYTGEEEDAMAKIEATDAHIDEMKKQIQRRLEDVEAHWREAYHTTSIEMHSMWQDRVGNAVTQLGEEAAAQAHEIDVLRRDEEAMWTRLKDLDREAAKHATKIVDKAGRELVSMTNKIEKTATKDMRKATSVALKDLRSAEKEGMRDTKDVEKAGRNLEFDLVSNVVNFGAEEGKVHRRLHKEATKGKAAQQRVAVQLQATYDEHEHSKDEQAKRWESTLLKVNRDVDKTMQKMQQAKVDMKREQGGIMAASNQELKKQGNYADTRLQDLERQNAEAFGKVHTQQVDLNKVHLDQLKKQDGAVDEQFARKGEAMDAYQILDRQGRRALSNYQASAAKQLRENAKGYDADQKRVAEAMPEELSRVEQEYAQAVGATQRDGRRAQTGTTQYSQHALAQLQLRANKYIHRLKDQPIPDREGADKLYNMGEELARHTEGVVDRAEPQFDSVVKEGEAVNREIDQLRDVYARVLQELDVMLRESASEADARAIKAARAQVLAEDKQLNIDVQEGKVVGERAGDALAQHAANIQRILQQIRLKNEDVLGLSRKLDREVKKATDSGKLKVKNAMSAAVDANKEAVTKLGSLQAFLAHVVKHAREGRGEALTKALQAFRADAKEIVKAGERDMRHQAEPDEEAITESAEAALERSRAGIADQKKELTEVVASYNSARGALSTAEGQAAKALSDQLEQLFREGELRGTNLAALRAAMEQTREQLSSRARTQGKTAMGGVEAGFDRIATVLHTKINEITQRMHTNEHDADDMRTALQHRVDVAAEKLGAEEANLAEQAKSFSQSAGRAAAYYEGIASKDYQALPNSEAETKRLLQNTERGLNQATEGSLGETEKMGHFMALLQSAGKAAMTEDQEQWNAELEKINGALTSGAKAVEGQALSAERTTPVSKAEIAAAEHQLKQALEKAGYDVEKTMASVNKRIDFLREMVPEEYAKGNAGLEDAQQPYRAKLNVELKDVDKTLQALQKADSDARAQQAASKAKQEAFMAKLEKGQNLEVSHDDEEIKEAIAQYKMVDFSMDDFDRWVGRYQSMDSKFNQKLYEKLQSLGVTVNANIFEAQQALGMEKLQLANEKASMHSGFVHDLLAAHADEKRRLSELQLGNDQLIAQIMAARHLSAAQKQQLIEQIRFSGLQLSKQILHQQGDLSSMNAKIAAHLSHFDEVFQTAKRAADMLAMNGPDAKQANKAVATLKQKADALDGIGLFSFVEEAAEARPERHLRSLQDEDETLAEANAALDADLTSLERRLGSELD